MRLSIYQLIFNGIKYKRKMKFNSNTESKNKIEDKNKNKRRNDLTWCIFHLANGTDTFNFVNTKDQRKGI